MPNDLLADPAEIIDQAQLDRRAIDQLGLKVGAAEAYQVQKASITRRLLRGETLVGIKMGLTSRAKMEQVNLQDPIWGRLTDAMTVEDGGTLDMRRLIQPRAEPEIAFKLKGPLSGTVTEEQAWAAIEAVAPAIEILDSRFQNFKFNLADALADNCSSAAYVIGPWQAPGADISDLRMEMAFDGQVVAAGSSADILGHPINSLIEGAKLTALYGGELRAGDVFLCGASTAAIPIRPGIQVSLEVQYLGDCSFCVTGS